MSGGQHISKIILDAGNYITIPRPLARFLGIETACFLMWLVEHDKNVSTEKTSSFYYDASVLKDQTGLSFYQQNKILNDLEEIEVLQIVGRVANNRKKICIDYELLDVLVLFLYSAKKGILAQIPLQKPKTSYGFVYFLKCLDVYKIGITAQKDKRRLQTYDTGNPFPKELLFFGGIKNYQKVEQTIIKKFAHKVYKGNEWFKLDEKDVKKILEFLNKKKCEANDE